MLGRENVVYDRVLEVEDIRGHIYGWRGQFPLGTAAGFEQWGLIYTCAAGFIDVAHMRDMIDLTRHYYRLLQTNAAPGDRYQVFGGADDKGDVKIRNQISTDADRVAVAMSLAYDQSIWHEIVSYWECETGMHHSSFSPEDLVSNKFGTYIGGKIVHAADFNKQAVLEMQALLRGLGAVHRAGTIDAFDGIERVWVDTALGTNVVGFFNQTYLRRRNFSVDPVSPWLVDRDRFYPLLRCEGSAGAIPNDFSPAVDAQARSFYQMTFKVPSNAKRGNGGKNPPCFASMGQQMLLRDTVTVDDYPQLIEEIKTAARLQYGPKFDQPGR